MYTSSLIYRKLLLAVGIMPLLCWGVAGDFVFFYVGSDVTTCIGVSKLNTTNFSKDNDVALHCVLDEDEKLGIGYLKKIWVPRESCPFYRNDYGVLDYRPCVADASDCPNDTDWYLSTDVYKYPRCLQESKTVIGSSTTTVTLIKDTKIDCLCPWMFVGPICFGLLILTILSGITAFRIITLKHRGWKGYTCISYCSEQVSNEATSHISPNLQPVGKADCGDVLSKRSSPLTTTLLSMQPEMNPKSSLPIGISTWPVLNADTRPSILHFGKNNPIYREDEDMQT